MELLQAILTAVLALVNTTILVQVQKLRRMAYNGTEEIRQGLPPAPAGAPQFAGNAYVYIGAGGNYHIVITHDVDMHDGR